MSNESLVESLRTKGVLVGLRGEDVRFLLDSGRMTPELRTRLHADRDRIAWELTHGSTEAASTTSSLLHRSSWREAVARALSSAAKRAGLVIDELWLADQVEAVEERAAILEADAGMQQRDAEARALEMKLVELDAVVPARETPVVFKAICDFGGPRGPHECPVRGCYCCGSREFVRVAAGPAWFCPRCHPPFPGAEIVERWTAPEPSWREARHA